MAKVLLVEDDQNLSVVLQMHLEHDRHMVDHVARGGDALAQLKSHTYDLVILDWMLPDITGVEVCSQFRRSGGKVPVLILTARGAVEDRAAGLDAGADDYLVKPFHPTELSARVRALLRRPSAITGKVLKVQELEMDTSECSLKRAGREIQLTSKEFALLELLMRYPNQWFTLESILDRLWHSDSYASIDTVRTHMKTLRKKIGDSDEGSLIQTKRGQGYRLVDSKAEKDGITP
ncbi:MAG TPA: response regulator transcription factor [Planktothrix sp.]|jgi:DNA-binding response OmpR family regulator